MRPGARDCVDIAHIVCIDHIAREREYLEALRGALVRLDHADVWHPQHWSNRFPGPCECSRRDDNALADQKPG